jgi:hypothetical protein
MIKVDSMAPIGTDISNIKNLVQEERGHAGHFQLQAVTRASGLASGPSSGARAVPLKAGLCGG